MSYRADIDGLRALAVLGVVLYHLGGFGLSGGYGGVDVFFVISGFLITHIVKSEIETGTFSFAHFYERRIRRIAPALFVVLIVSTVLAAALLLPVAFQEFGKSLQAVLILNANYYFARKTGYFAATSEEKPLLHTWSLAVEEQFYILFPLILFALMTRRPKAVVPVLAAVFAASMLLSLHQVTTTPAPAFFSTAGRAWELLLGALLAFMPAHSQPKQDWKEAAGWGGVFLILAGYFIYDQSTLFPGPSAAIFCFGAALVIYAGIDGHMTSAGRILSLPPLVRVGQLSYSLYLWHWPLLVFWRYRFGDSGTWRQSAGLLLASLALAALSWRYIERPFRRGHAVPSRRIFTLFGAATAALSVLAIAVIKSDGAPARWPADTAALLIERRLPDEQVCKTLAGAEAWRKEICVLGNSEKIDLVVWGDSHARMFIDPISQAISTDGKSALVAWLGACPPLVGVTLYGRSKSASCQAFSEFVLKYIERMHPRRVVISARWAHYMAGAPSKIDGGVPIILSPDGMAQNAKVAEKLLTETIERIQAAGSEVMIIGPVPEQGFLVASRIARSRAWNQDLPPELPLAEYLERQKNVLPFLRRLSASRNIRLILPDRYFCDQISCRYANDGKPLYFDHDHLNPYGMEVLAPIVRDILTFPAS
ncbi:MAG: acyltransferase family protein [Hyphomicrobium sp.]